MLLITLLNTLQLYARDTFWCNLSAINIILCILQYRFLAYMSTSVRLVVCMSVTFVRPTQAIKNFRQCFCAIWYVGHLLTSVDIKLNFQTPPMSDSDFGISELFISTRPTGQRVRLRGNQIHDTALAEGQRIPTLNGSFAQFRPTISALGYPKYTVPQYRW